MNKFNTLTLVLVLMTFSLVINANTLQNSFDQNKPTDMGDKQWSSLKSAVQEVKLLPSAGGGVDHNFGNSVSVDGNRMVVGAPNYSLNNIIHGAVYVFDFDGTTWNESQILIPFDGVNDDQFGISVSLSGTRLLIGAPNDDDLSFNAGVVFIYDFDGVSWVFTQKLTADDAGSGYNFGTSLSLSGNRALIGSDKSKDNLNNITGAAYVFDFDGNSWGQTQKLIATDASASDFFGASVSLSGNRVLIGAFADDDNATNSGSAYIFEFDGNNWSQTKKLIAPNGNVFDLFGVSVSLSGTRALIGSEGDDESNSNSGAAYIFDFDGNDWNQTKKITASDANASDHFGNSVSLSGNSALIGASFDDDNGDNSGSAYLFDLIGNNWSQTQKIIALDTGVGDSFGFSVSLSGNRALIGAHLDDSNGDNSGSVYVFDKIGTTWEQSHKLIAEAGTFATNHFFGNSVSISNNRALIGTPNDDSRGINSGAAYIFDFDGNNWNQTIKIIANDGETNDRFGFSVSLLGDSALIGSIGDDGITTDSGAAYIFYFDGVNWSQANKIIADDAEFLDQFGFSVSLSDNRALIGTYSDAPIGRFGSAYIFDFDGNNWSQTTRLTADIGEAGDRFGFSVSLSGNRALIGAKFIGNRTGAAYIFDFDGNWNLTKKLTAEDGEVDDIFGGAVSLSGNRALIGAYKDDDNGNNSGAAYIFDFDGNNWSQTKKITAEDGEANDLFGFSVSLLGNKALIGARSDDDNGIASGAAYIVDFDGNNWTQTTKITTTDGERFDAFGSSVSLSSNRVLIGAFGDDDRGSGSAYIFTDFNDLIFENSFEN